MEKLTRKLFNREKMLLKAGLWQLLQIMNHFLPQKSTKQLKSSAILGYATGEVIVLVQIISNRL